MLCCKVCQSSRVVNVRLKKEEAEQEDKKIFWTETVSVSALQLRMVGSTFRLLPEAQIMAKFLPLDTVSLRYVAWEVLVEVRCACGNETFTCLPELAANCKNRQ